MHDAPPDEQYHCIAVEYRTTKVAPPPLVQRPSPFFLSKTGATSSHHFSLAHQFRVKLAAIQSQVDVKVDPVKGALWRVHAFKILFQILS